MVARGAVAALLLMLAGAPQARAGDGREHAEIVRAAAERFAIPEAWIWEVMRAESGFEPRAVSRAGAMGLMQLMPPTYAAMALTIALITALWCLTLCAFAERIAARMRAHARIGLALRRLAGLCMIGFGLRLLRS